MASMSDYLESGVINHIFRNDTKRRLNIKKRKTMEKEAVARHRAAREEGQEEEGQEGEGRGR